MYDSSSLIQSKHVFALQQFAHTIMTNMKGSDSHLYISIKECYNEISETMLNYHESKGVQEEIVAYERFALNVARFSALIEHLPEDIMLFPGRERMSRESKKFYHDLIEEFSQKLLHLEQLRQINGRATIIGSSEIH